MNDEKVKEYDNFIVNNYNLLKGFCKSIDAKNDYENLMQTSYLKCRERIMINGYDGKDFLNYFRCTAMNTYKSEYRQKQKKQLIDIEDQCYYNTIEDSLQQQNEQDKQNEDIHNQISYIINGIYDYLDTYFDEKQIFVFKIYFLLKHKHLNYKQLSDATGYSITSVSNIIKKIKKELRINLITYLKTGMNKEELLQEVKKLIDKGQNWNDSRIMYTKITGQRWSNCKCKTNQLYNFIIEWYNNNKT